MRTVLIAVVLAVACTGRPANYVEITQYSGSGDPCVSLMATGGVLVAHEDWGLAIQNAVSGQPQRLLWPPGWYGLRDGEDVVLTEASGRAVASTGDTLHLGGATGLADHFAVCRDQVTVS